MGFFLSLFSSKTTWFFIVAALIAGLIGFQHVRINYLKGEVVERDAEVAAARAETSATRALVGQWQVAYDTLSSTVDTQNTAISRLEVEVARRMAIAKEAIRLADAARVKADGMAEAIQQMEVAKDECTGMRQLLDAYSDRVQ